LFLTSNNDIIAQLWESCQLLFFYFFSTFLKLKHHTIEPAGNTMMQFIGTTLGGSPPPDFPSKATGITPVVASVDDLLGLIHGVDLEVLITSPVHGRIDYVGRS
jgi:hypothetical protein